VRIIATLSVGEFLAEWVKAVNLHGVRQNDRLL
jgi:hypothetical protein